MSCKINEDVEIKVYKDEHNLCEVLHIYPGMDTLLVHVAGKRIYNIIREYLSSRYDINCTPDMKKKSNNKICLRLWQYDL